MKKVLSICLGWMLVCNAFAVTMVKEYQDTPELTLDLQYPQGFQSQPVNTAVMVLIDKLKEDFEVQVKNDQQLPAEIPGKSSLTVRYAITYQYKDWLSMRINFSIFPRGAAHPNHWLQTFNVYQGKILSLSDLFHSELQALQQLSQLSRKHLLKQAWADQQWISDGTAAKADNYQLWLLTKEGLMILFDTYQVTSYAYGPQTVNIPFSAFKPQLKPQFRANAWGHS